MNERIKQLALQATKVYKPEWNGDVGFEEFDKEKFAELIVQKCVEHLESNVIVPNIEHSRTKTKCIRSIKDHFGVEE
jgi:hypothetical protein